MWLCNNKYIIENPLKCITPPEPLYEDKRALDKSEIKQILSAISLDYLRHHNKLLLSRDILIVDILFFCGLRRGELFSLQIMDIDIPNGVLTINGATSKSRKTHTVPIHPTLMMHLKSYLSERQNAGYTTPYLLVSSNGDWGLGKDGLKHWVNKYKKLSGVKFHLHRFRHSFACELFKGNTQPTRIKMYMGHSSLKMTGQYLRSINPGKDLKEDVLKLSYVD